jgi:hypothetical protein
MLFKRILYLFVLSFLINSCVNSIDGNGNVINETRDVDSFNKINISGGYEVIINQGDKESLEIEIDENLLEYIKTEVKNNTLFISSDKSFGKAEALRLYITVVNIKDIDVSGAIELSNKGTYIGEKLEIEVSGAGDINLDLVLENLTMELSGASETNLKGSATDFEIELSGASELAAEKFKTQHTVLDISGAGEATVFAKKTLEVEISGAGTVRYKGNPKIKKDISGAGSIKEL